MRIISPAIVFLLFLLTSFCNAQSLKCTRVVDGDTIKLSNGERVRLIGVDTPETKHPKKPVEYFGMEVMSDNQNSRGKIIVDVNQTPVASSPERLIGGKQGPFTI